MINSARCVIGLLSLWIMVVIVPVSHSDDEHSIENLVAFTKVIGYVRYFYPADSAINWDDFAATHADSVMNASNDAALIALLNQLFNPHAPLLHIYESASTAVPAYTVNPDEPYDALVQWVHVPFMSGDEDSPLSPIGGQLVTIDLIDGERPSDFEFRVDHHINQTITLATHDPTALFTADLSPTVRIAMPLAHYIVQGDAAPTATHTVTPVPSLTITGNSLSGRLAIIIHAWNYFQHFFSYWDVLEDDLGIDWDAVLREALRNALADEDALDFTETLRRMIAYLNDGHTYVNNSPEAKDLIENNNSMRLFLPFTWTFIDEELIITTLKRDTVDGIHLGDKVLAIDGQAVSERLADERAITAAHGAYGDHYIAMLWLVGFPETSLTLTIDPIHGDAPYDVQVPFDVFPGFSSRVMDDLFDVREDRPDTITAIDDEIVYIDLTRITDRQYQEALDQFAAAQGLVFDMRGYPKNNVALPILGHLVDHDLQNLPFFVPVVIAPDHENMPFIEIVMPDFVSVRQPRFTDNVVFITNFQHTISLSESVMSMVAHYQLGDIVGSPTAGALGNATRPDLLGGYTMIYTGMRVTQFDGSPVFTVGIAPTIPVTRTRQGIADGRDELLEHALENVRQQMTTDTD